MKRMQFDKKIVLVAGGAGFIGSHLCEELLKTAKVICIDDFSTGSEINIDHLLADPDFEFIRHDLSETLDLDSFPELEKFKLRFQGVQEIYNLACPMSPKDFEKNILKTLWANSLVVKNLLELAVYYQAKFLHFSSSVVYGYDRPQEKRISESDLGSVDQLSERAAYDEGKRFAETIVKAYASSSGVQAKIIRLFRIYGPRMKMGDGQMLPDFVKAALENRDLEIYGDEKFASSFCYISDAIDAVLRVMDAPVLGPFNVGSDVRVPVREVADKIIKQCGARSQIVYREPLLFMKPLAIPDISKVRNELAWMPVVTLDKGLAETIYHLRVRKGLVGIGQENI